MKPKYLIIFIYLFLFNCSKSNSSEDICFHETWYRDIDGDGIGDPNDSITSCNQPEGYVALKSILDTDPTEPNKELLLTPGTQEIFLLNDTRANYGFALYTPEAYNEEDTTGFPLLIYLHGGGGRGDGRTTASFDRVIFGITPPNLIKEKRWNTPEPMIVASPQSPGLWQPQQLHNFIAYLKIHINVNPSRIYMTGLSMGGRGVFDYITAFGDDAYPAAVVPIAGWSLDNKGEPFKNIPLWAFHGDADNIINVNSSIRMVNAINSNTPTYKAKLSIFPGVDHFSWQKVYDNSGIGTASSEYDAYNMSIYEWILEFENNRE